MFFIDLRTAVFSCEIESQYLWRKVVSGSAIRGKKIIHFQFYFLSGILLSELLFVIFGAASRWIQTVYSTVQPGSVLHRKSIVYRKLDFHFFNSIGCTQ